jgi:putative Mn2+ efflux pump MntP
VLTLLLVAASLGLDNLAVAIGIGISGSTARARLEVGIIFGLFEAGMPLVGLLLGHRLAHDFGNSTRWIGGGLLVATGLHGLCSGLRPDHDDTMTGRPPRTRLVLTGLALSIDNLVVGFALGTHHIAVVLAAAVIGVISVTLSLIGLELGARIGARTGDGAEAIGSVVLIAVGIAVASGLL